MKNLNGTIVRINGVDYKLTRVVKNEKNEKKTVAVVTLKTKLGTICERHDIYGKDGSLIFSVKEGKYKDASGYEYEVIYMTESEFADFQSRTLPLRYANPLEVFLMSLIINELEF